MVAILLVPVAGCAVDSLELGLGEGTDGIAWELPTDAERRPVVQSLTVTTATSIVRDVSHVFTVDGADAGETVRLFAAREVGPGPCNGTGTVCLDIAAPAKRLTAATADASGTASISFTFPSTALGSGDYVAVQALVVRGADGSSSVGTAPLLLQVDGDGDGVTPDAGDCDDLDAEVYPGQTSWFGEPRSDGTFDYDCDGVDELQYPDAYTFFGECPFAMWRYGVPACGERGYLESGCYNEPPYGCVCDIHPNNNAQQACR